MKYDPEDLQAALNGVMRRALLALASTLLLCSGLVHAAAANGLLNDTGHFDFTRVCFDGALEGTNACTGTLVANGTPSASNRATTDWACTKDNVTQLIWSLQSGQGDWGNFAKLTLPNEHNTSNRCGFNSGWRPPTRSELLSLVQRGLSDGTIIDTNYFPSTPSNWYWTNDTYAPVPNVAWFVSFYDGNSYTNLKTLSFYVRLVRSVK